MNLPNSIAADVDTAHDLITRDLSPTWMISTAAMLEDCAKRIRKAVEEEKAKVEKREVKP